MGCEKAIGSIGPQWVEGSKVTLAALAFAAGVGLLQWGLKELGPWSAFVWVPAVLWVVALLSRSARTLAVGLVLGFAACGVVAQAGRLELAVVAAVVLLWAWDIGLLGVRLARVDQVVGREELWKSQLLRASLLAASGGAVGLLFSRVRLELSFWPLLGALGVLFILLRRFSQQVRKMGSPHQVSGGDSKGEGSSSSPPSTG